ncbi:MAG: EpsG family protein [Muribaculum sp.]|nr:EpsG family protein [Muribaculum sp.]
MIDGYLYHPIYLIIITIITIVTAHTYSRYPQSRINVRTSQDKLPSLALMTFMILFIGLRPVHRAFVDMMNYSEFFSYEKSKGYFSFDWNAENLVFDNLYSFLAYKGYDITTFMFLIAAIYFGTMWAAIRKWFPNDTLYAYVVCLAAFSSFSYSTNGVKAGAAASIFLLALAYHDNIKLTIILSFLSWFFHHSMSTVMVMYALTFFVKNPKIYLYGWIICVAFSIVHINPFQSLMVSMTDEHGAIYLLSTNDMWGGKTGYRIDFLLYSAVPILIGAYVIFQKKIQTTTYNQLFNLYLGVNALWVLCMYIPFNNRVAYLSWFMLPVVSVYPYLKINLQTNGTTQYRQLNKISYFYLFFTLFMYFIYYNQNWSL